MNSYELAKKLKEAGFPQMPHGKGDWRDSKGIRTPEGSEIKDGDFYVPTLSELIEACGRSFKGLEQINFQSGGWAAYGILPTMDISIEERLKDQYEERKVLNGGKGSTPEEAVANLWLELNKK